MHWASGEYGMIMNICRISAVFTPVAGTWPASSATTWIPRLTGTASSSRRTRPIASGYARQASQSPPIRKRLLGKEARNRDRARVCGTTARDHSAKRAERSQSEGAIDADTGFLIFVPRTAGERTRSQPARACRVTSTHTELSHNIYYVFYLERILIILFINELIVAVTAINEAVF